MLVVSLSAAAVEAPSDLLMKEYAAARKDGIARLGLQYVARLDLLKRNHLKAGSLDNANAIDAAIKSLGTGAESDGKGDAVASAGALSPDASAVMGEYAKASQAGLEQLNRIYAEKMQAVKVQAQRAGDLEGANAAENRLKELAEELKTLRGDRLGEGSLKIREDFTVEGFVDGNTELRVNKQGVFWKVRGGESKVGMNDGKKFPSYVDGSRWQPEWANKSTDRGPDFCAPFPLASTAPDLTAELVSISKDRFGPNNLKRSAISFSIKEGDFVVTIPDAESGACWYKIKIRALKK